MRETNPLLIFEKHPTHRNAVAAKCAECMGCSPIERIKGLSTMVRECSSHSCPLHRLRPYQADSGQISLVKCLDE